MAEEVSEHCVLEHHCLESDLGSIKVWIILADRSLRLTQRVSEHMQLWPEIWNMQNLVAQEKRG